MKLLALAVLFGVLTGVLCRPRNIIDFETDKMKHEQEGTPGKAVEGEYSWIAPNGQEFTVKYVADHRGYRVVESEGPIPRAAHVAVDDDSAAESPAAVVAEAEEASAGGNEEESKAPAEEEEEEGEESGGEEEEGDEEGEEEEEGERR